MSSLDSKCQDGIILHQQGNIDEAEHAYIEVLQQEPYHSRALRLLEFITFQRNRVKLNALKDALARCDQAIACKPDSADGYVRRGAVLRKLKRHEDALASYEAALALEPDYEYLSCTLLNVKMEICDFSYAENELARIDEKLMRCEKAYNPLTMIYSSGSPSVQRKAAELFVYNRRDSGDYLPYITKYSVRKRIRLGYFSGYYCNGPTMDLIAEVIEKHDRSSFEAIAFSVGEQSNDEMRRRAMIGFDKFIDTQNLIEKQVALLSRNLEVDVAINLDGLRNDRLTGIFALRAAPIQVNYLGYPGTMAANFIDYVIADQTLIPTSHQEHYSEKVAYLPYSYQPNDRNRAISDLTFTRHELGLPDNGFVFCCFNNNLKINPGVFDIWMRILQHVEGSVLWLLEDNATAANNLRKEASLRSVNQHRLIFAPRIPLAEHLARHRFADLFLDTLPCNAHTTASDALWTGLPVLTQIGETFAGRVAASLLTAIGLADLIAETPETYEAMAIELATHPEKLTMIKNRLSANRLSTPLFDTVMYTKHLEAAYTSMYERYHADLAADHIFVEA